MCMYVDVDVYVHVDIYMCVAIHVYTGVLLHIYIYIHTYKPLMYIAWFPDESLLRAHALDHRSGLLEAYKSWYVG